MADARIRVELTADDAKKKLKAYKAKKKKEKKKATLLEKRAAKEKDRVAKRDEKLDKITGRISRAGDIIRSPIGEATAAASRKFREKQTGVTKAIELATAAFSTAQAANEAAIMLGGGLKEMGGTIGELVGAPMVSVAETLQENVFDFASNAMNAAKIAADAQASFGKAKIGLGARALEGIADFAFKEGGRRTQIETREREETGAMVADVIKKMTGWGG